MPNLATVKQKVAEADAKQGTGGLLTKKVDAAVKGMMAKKVNPNQPWQSVLVVDRSGSMDGEYRSGSVQDAVERALGFAVIVDDDGDVPAVFFDHSVFTREVKLNNFHDFINRERIGAGGSTNLTDALKAAAEITGNGDLFKGSGMFHRGAAKPSIQKMATPAFITVVTDGVPNDPRSAADVIRACSFRAMFFKFLYVGHDAGGWRFLESLDDDIPVGVPIEQGGRLIDNVDAKKMGNLSGVADDVFYDAMLDEVSTYLTAAKANGLI
jgi:hypothetical protein